MKTIAVTSGKGGVGKSTMTANLAYALALQGRRVLILDGDIGMANIDIVFGKRAEHSILDVLNGKRDLSEVIVDLTPQISFIPGGHGIIEANKLNSFDRRNMMDVVTQLEHRYDVMLLDTAPGLSENVLYLNAASQMSVVIVTPDPASFADSYGLIKLLHQEYRENKFSILCNQVANEHEGFQQFNRFNEVVHRFLNVSLDYVGSMPFDPLFKKSTQGQRLIVKHEPLSTGAQAIAAIAAKLDRKVQYLHQKTGLQFFWEQAVGVA